MMRKRVATWLNQPIIIPRWSLALMYATLFLISLIIPFARASAIDQYIGYSGRAIWSVLLMLTAITCLIGSLRRKWEPMERWGAFALSLLLLYYGGLAWAGSNGASIILAILALAVPSARAFALLGRTGLKA
jgi:phosphatidylglycerophosphate synthase